MRKYSDGTTKRELKYYQVYNFFFSNYAQIQHYEKICAKECLFCLFEMSENHNNTNRRNLLGLFKDGKLKIVLNALQCLVRKDVGCRSK